MSEEKNYVRTMLVNSKNHRYVTELDTMGVSEYMQLMIKPQQGTPSLILDFSQLVEILHTNIDKKNKYYEEAKVKIERSSIYNIWKQIKESSDSSFAGALAANLVTKSEDLLNLIHSRLPILKADYRSSHQNTTLEAPNKSSAAFSNFISNIDAALEVLLCRVYISAKFGFETLINDVVMTGHCRAIRDVVLAELKRDIGYNEAQADFYHYSPLYHACIEDIGINPNALCYLLGSSITSEDLKNRLIAEGNSAPDGRDQFQTTLRWTWCDHEKAGRIREFSKMLLRLNMLLGMLEELHGTELQFDNDNKYRDNFKDALTKLLT